MTLNKILLQRYTSSTALPVNNILCQNNFKKCSLLLWRSASSRKKVNKNPPKKAPNKYSSTVFLPKSSFTKRIKDFEKYESDIKKVSI